MFCKKCGSEIKSDAKFCKICGSNVQEFVVSGKTHINNYLGRGGILWFNIFLAVFIIGGIGFIIARHYDKQETVVRSQVVNANLGTVSTFRDKVVSTKPQSYKAIQEEDLSTIISQWKDRVAEVDCEWQTQSGESYLDVKGSALIMDVKGYGVSAVTNRHIIDYESENGKVYYPEWCIIGVYGIGARAVSLEDEPFNSGTKHDWAIISMDIATKKSDDEYFTNLPSVKVCNEAKIGDKLVVLGYPSIGTTDGITATEGIVSGIEGDYYVTSAKIDHGNSGGAAILLKDNCYLGIPSWSESGEIESLGRILDARVIFD